MKVRTARGVALIAGVLAVAVSLTACSSNKDGTATGDSTTPPAGQGDIPAPGDAGAAGFTEYPIGDEIDLGPIIVNGVYFQPVDMEPASQGLPAAESDMHIEADIAAAEGNNLGYGVGDFVPNLTVDYQILTEDGTQAASGTFMPMSASDGPHYGANIKLPSAGIYKVSFIIHSPEEDGYVLHVDKDTGVTGKFWTEPLTATWDAFEYVPREW
jgi:uncharacterized protein involved in high-affinity Fe2+ transport